MNVIEQFKEKARKDPKRIVLPEGEEARVIEAAGISAKERVAHPILLGERRRIMERASDLNIELENVEIVHPSSSSKLVDYASLYCEIRKRKGVTEKLAKRILKKNLYFGAMMVRAGDADGMVAGAVNLTTSVLRAGGLIIGLQKSVSQPSSFFIMDVPDFVGGEKGVLIFADAAVNPDPAPSQLADIAISSAKSAKILLGWEPRVAMLSFSTKGSAHHPLVDKVIEATEIAKKTAPHLLIDRELQVDAAIIPEVARRKLRESDVVGRANILFFLA